MAVFNDNISYESVNLFCKEPVSKYFQLCGLVSRWSLSLFKLAIVL